MRKLLTIIWCLLSSLVFAQQTEEAKLVQFSGVIYDVDSNTVMPYVTIRNLTAGKAYSANYKGYFSFVVNEGDTISLSSVGYKKLLMVIPRNLKDKKYTSVIRMKSDNIELPVVRVFPWASIDEFKRDFLTMKFADDDYEIAKKNLARATLRDFTYTLPRDGREIQGMTFNNNHIGLSNKNMTQTNPLLNPFAWGAFIKQLQEGNKNKDK
ncbi:hypothetical protein EIM50_26410 [Pseudoxanthomonas sp. SGD-10]|nr:hypothetical protein EIM50_26410 [Pseudoxanthomonas sp. SGD-10]